MDKLSIMLNNIYFIGDAPYINRRDRDVTQPIIAIYLIQ
jgi:hypothetical protein